MPASGPGRVRFVKPGIDVPIGKATVVELPMTEGRYTWLWQVGDATAGRGGGGAPDPALTGTRTVRPLQRVSNAYPGR